MNSTEPRERDIEALPGAERVVDDALQQGLEPPGRLERAVGVEHFGEPTRLREVVGDARRAGELRAAEWARRRRPLLARLEGEVFELVGRLGEHVVVPFEQRPLDLDAKARERAFGGRHVVARRENDPRVPLEIVLAILRRVHEEDAVDRDRPRLALQRLVNRLRHRPLADELRNPSHAQHGVEVSMKLVRAARPSATLVAAALGRVGGRFRRLERRASGEIGRVGAKVLGEARALGHRALAQRLPPLEQPLGVVALVKPLLVQALLEELVREVAGELLLVLLVPARELVGVGIVSLPHHELPVRHHIAPAGA